MRRLCALALLAALGAALLVRVVQAQQPVIPQWVDANGQRKSVTPSTAFPSEEKSKDRDFVLIQPNVISNIFGDKNVCSGVQDGRDSSMMIPTRGYNRLRLRWRVTFPTQALCGWTPTRTTVDSLFAITFAVGARTNTSSAWDTTAGTIRQDWVRGSLSMQADTVGSLTEVMRGSSWLDNNPDYGEFVVVWPNISDDTEYTGAGLGTPNIVRTNFSREFDLLGKDGQPIVGDYTMITWRMLQSIIDATAPVALAAGKPVFVAADLLGSRQ
jgi:hypothetical protein